MPKSLEQLEQIIFQHQHLGHDLSKLIVLSTKASLGLDTTDTPQFAGLGLGTALGSNEVLKIGGQYYSAEHDNGNLGATATINWANGNSQKGTLTANCTLTFSNLKSGANYTLEIVQGAGPYTITWPTIKWENQTAPTLTVTDEAIDMIGFMQRASGTLGVYAYNFG